MAWLYIDTEVEELDRVPGASSAHGPFHVTATTPYGRRNDTHGDLTIHKVLCWYEREEEWTTRVYAAYMRVPTTGGKFGD